MRCQGRITLLSTKSDSTVVQYIVPSTLLTFVNERQLLEKEKNSNDRTMLSIEGIILQFCIVNKLFQYIVVVEQYCNNFAIIF